MAEATTGSTEITFESLEEDILINFEQLHLMLDERMQIVMSKLVAIKGEAERTTELDEGIAKLKQAKENTLATLKGNVIGKERKALEKTFDDQIKEAETRKLSEKSCLVKLRCYMKKLEEGISQIDLVEQLPIYADKVAPIIKCGKRGHGKSEFSNPRGICIDSITSNVYVADTHYVTVAEAGSKRIQVVTQDGTHVMEFGSKHLTDPWGVALTEQYVYVTDKTKHTIVQFKRNGAFIKQVGGRGTGQLQFDSPSGIAAYNDKLYVCDLMNDRIQILDLSLKFIKEFTEDYLISPTAIHITDTAIHVLPQLGNIIYLFSHTTHAVMQTVILTGQEYNMVPHFYFAKDLSENYFVSALEEHGIRIFDKTGALRHIIGEGYMQYPGGIAVTANNNIICVTGAANNKFLVF